MKVLISGFEAFDGMNENPTDLLVKEILKGSLRISSNVDLRAVTLPVVFGDSFAVLEQQIKSFKPDYVLAFGVARGREFIEFERIAINCMDAQISDNKGMRPAGEKINPKGPDGLFTTLPLINLLNSLTTRGHKVKISNSAGTYVCNYVFYKMMETSSGSSAKCGFIHVPPDHIISIEELLRTTEAIIESLRVT